MLSVSFTFITLINLPIYIYFEAEHLFRMRSYTKIYRIIISKFHLNFHKYLIIKRVVFMTHPPPKQCHSFTACLCTSGGTRPPRSTIRSSQVQHPRQPPRPLASPRRLPGCLRQLPQPQLLTARRLSQQPGQARLQLQQG